MKFDGTSLSLGTGFCWKKGDKHFLITNWHNLSGKNPRTGIHLSPTLAEPNLLDVGWNVKDQLGSKAGTIHPLRDGNGKPLWFVHPIYGRKVDVVALPIDPPTHADPHPINEMPSVPLTIGIGQDVFILGYPFGLGHSGLPIWKRGSVASEPEILDSEWPCVLVDTASREGMSGSPVVRRSWGMAQLENGDMTMGAGYSTRFVGVYSGRLHTADPIDAQLGMYWPAEFVPEIVDGAVRDD